MTGYFQYLFLILPVILLNLITFSTQSLSRGFAEKQMNNEQRASGRTCTAYFPTTLVFLILSCLKHTGYDPVIDSFDHPNDCRLLRKHLRPNYICRYTRFQLKVFIKSVSQFWFSTDNFSLCNVI